MRISDWSSDVCSSDLAGEQRGDQDRRGRKRSDIQCLLRYADEEIRIFHVPSPAPATSRMSPRAIPWSAPSHRQRSEEHTSELQSLMRISSAVFCLKKKKY